MRSILLYSLSALLSFGFTAVAQDASSPSPTLSAVVETVTPTPEEHLFPAETKQLTDAALQGLSETELSLFAFDDYSTSAPVSRIKRSATQCKVFPGDRNWPSDAIWKLLDVAVGGALLKPVPAAAVCYEGPYYNPSTCAAISANWTNSYSHLDDPLEMFWPFFQGETCQPPSNDVAGVKSCTQGGYPVYVVKATYVAQIQLAINFARATGVRLVVRNTGHDFSGKSGGAGSLSIWTHNLKDMTFISNYNDKGSGYKGPAIKAGAGVQAFELYKFAKTNKMVAVGGEGQTVGIMGGYIQGGGHSPLSSLKGMGADHVLSMEVVTPDGRFVTASASENTDLFWALRGGGGGTFGVVTSVTIKVYPDMQTTIAAWTYKTGGAITGDVFWAGVRAYMKYFPTFVDAGTYAYWNIFPDFVAGPGTYVFTMQPFFFAGKSQAESKALVAPLLSELAALGIKITPTWNTYNNFYDAWMAGFPLETVEQGQGATASRLWPRNNFASAAALNATAAAFRYQLDQGYFIIAFHQAPTLKAGGYPDNSVNPAWRNAISHANVVNSWGPGKTKAQQKASRDKFINVDMQKWRDLTPGSGGYLSESDRLEPNFQQAFWGSMYPRLLKIKQKYDPKDVFWAATAVGSEGWSVVTADGLPTENGRLCRT